MADEDEKTEGDDELEGAADFRGPNPMIVLALVGMNSLLTIGVLVLVLMKPDPPPATVAAAPAMLADGGPAPVAAAEIAEPEVEAELDVDGNPVHKKKPIRGPIEKLEDIVIQLRNPEFDRFARISFEMELGGDDDLEYVQAYKPRIRDAFISYLSDRSYEELRGSRGLTRVKKALTARVHEVVSGDRVKALYVTNFIIQ